MINHLMLLICIIDKWRDFNDGCAQVLQSNDVDLSKQRIHIYDPQQGDLTNHVFSPVSYGTSAVSASFFEQISH